MNFFELRDLKMMLKNIDHKNENDLTSFKNMLSTKIEDRSFVKNVVSYLESDLAVYSDAEIADLTEDELQNLVQFINQ